MNRRSTNMPPEDIQKGLELLRSHQAKESVRQQQQGHGRPIISLVYHGYRLVAVGGALFWSKEWRVFPDFLLYFLKKTLGLEWGAREKPKGQHPLFRWLEKFNDYSARTDTDGKVKIGPITGFLACWLHLAYALYLIQHHDQIPKRLLKRLRELRAFYPAYYEAIVGAALAVAGLELSAAETKTTGAPTPEFRAKSKISGIRYEVEAKRKDRWNAPTDNLNAPSFEQELRAYVRDQIYNASKKKLANPIYCFELSIPTLTTEAQWRAIASKVDVVIREAETTITVEGQPIAPAFLLLTNHTFLVNENMIGAPVFGSLATIRIDDFPMGRPVEIEAALEGYDKYRDIFALADAWTIASTVPITFDGSPPELLSPEGQSGKTVQIGDMLAVPDEEGNQVVARVEQIVSVDKSAIAIVHDTAANKRWLVGFPLTDAEAKAAARFTDAIFGNAGARRALRETDPFDLYDFFLETYGSITQEQADRLFTENPAFQAFRGLPLKQARVRIAREYTKMLWARRSQNVSDPSGYSGTEIPTSK